MLLLWITVIIFWEKQLRSSWHIVGKDFTAAVLDFFNKHKLSKQANATLLASIPKMKIVTSVANFRPISCCSVIYKTITKILIEILKPLMPHLVGYEQAAFVSKRNIFENIMISQGLIKGSWFTIKLNGRCHSYFKGRSGVRQGDPLSPILCVLSMEILFRLLRNLETHNQFSCHLKCLRLKLTHLIFANDLMIFT